MNVSSVCGSWNSNINGSMVSILGLESNNRKQFWDLENNTNTTTHFDNNNGNPFINPTTNIFDCSNLSSSSSNFATNFFPYSQFNDYSSTGYLKEEDGGFGIDEGNYSSSGRIGLNLGHRTYFSSRETVVIDQLLQRPRGFYQANQVPRCQAEGCRIDLTNAKQYHKRHKVCEHHSKAIKVVASGLEQRFCQQCSRFHLLTEFDESKRSCRKRLADHNRRRRKPQHGSSDSIPYKTAEKAFSQVKSSVSSPRSELKETSLSSPILPLMVSKSTINNKASTIIAESNWVFKETEATTQQRSTSKSSYYYTTTALHLQQQQQQQQQ